MRTAVVLLEPRQDLGVVLRQQHCSRGDRRLHRPEAHYLLTLGTTLVAFAMFVCVRDSFEHLDLDGVCLCVCEVRCLRFKGLLQEQLHAGNGLFDAVMLVDEHDVQSSPGLW